LIAESTFTCNTRYLNLAFNDTTYAYYFAVPPGLHGEDTAYTFFNGDTSTSNYGLPVNGTVARAFQDYLTSFAMQGNPNEKGVPFFPLYGANDTTLTVDLKNDGALVKDTVANARCDWWQKAVYF